MTQKTLTFAAMALFGALAGSGCAHEPAPARELPVVWDDIVHENGKRAEREGARLATAPRPVAARSSGHLSQVDPAARAALDQGLVQSRLAALSPALRADPVLARLAVRRALAESEVWENGVFGKHGHAKVYITSTERIADFDRLYFVMVQMLSRKYGCFMMAKVRVGDYTKVRCKDQRQIVLHRSKGDGWIQFAARQFDREGYEIIVRQRRIVRVGAHKAI